jgi:hypothetical protein
VRSTLARYHHLVLFIATVDGNQGIHFVWLAPVRYRFDVNTRPRPARGTRLAIVLPTLAAPTREALDAWRAQHAPTGELVPPYYREAALADLMDAVNAELHLDLAREASADELAAFALDRGGALLAELRAAIAAGKLETAPAFATRVARFAAICGIATAPATLEELATMHPVEQLMAFEHAVVQWVQATTEPPPDELAALAKHLPDDRASAGASRAWFRWWWRLSYRAPRGDLRDAVTAAVELARRECAGASIAHDALAEADAMLDRLRVADASRLWAEPPDSPHEFPPARDDDDAHSCAYMAVTHAAHALAAALRADHDAGEANREAMRSLAMRAVDVLLHGE